MSKIKVAITGVGNCVSSLIQGIWYYKNKTEKEAVGLMHWNLGGYLPSDIDVVCAFDIDRRKVGKDVSEAIFSLPNNTTVFCEDVPLSGGDSENGAVFSMAIQSIWLNTTKSMPLY